MAFNSQTIIRDIRMDFEKMLDFVTGKEAHTATASQIERGVFQLLLDLGAKLLALFFAIRSEAGSRTDIQPKEGQKLPYLRDTPRTYFSIFGKITFFRPYFYRKGMPGQIPLDAELSLGADCYSDLLREVAEYLGVYNPYHKVSDILTCLLHLNLSTRALDQSIATDAADVTAYYDRKPAPLPGSEAEILVIQGDGKGVPMILAEPAKAKVRLGKGEKRGHKKEAIVTTVYSIEPKPRTPKEVVDSFFHQEDRSAEEKQASQHIRPQNKQIWATLEGKDTALSRLVGQVQPRLGTHIRHQVALCDGCEALQSRIARQFPDFTLVLDFIHADEYLWDVANSLFGGENSTQRLEWMKSHTLQLLSGQTTAVIDELRCLSLTGKSTSAQKIQLNKSADYFERNLPYMDYSAYLAKGLPIASGVIEGACRHFVKDRCELSGMRWSQTGAENLLHLRAVAENGDWEAYHDFRRHRRHTRLYASPYPDQPLPENRALDPNGVAQATSRTPVPNRSRQSGYQQLPLAA
jgi:hypothetical protein